MNVDLGKSMISEAQKKHLRKDQYKSDHANVLVVTPGSIGASAEYARLWKQVGKPVNPGQYVGTEIVFVSTNGLRRMRKPVHDREIVLAANAGCAFLTDARRRRPEGGNPYNIGEQEVAELLRRLGYTEQEEFGGLVARWQPQPKAK